MTVRIHADSRRHRFVRPDADPRLAWTRCGIRFAWDPQAYRYALRILGLSEPRERCPGCWG